MLTTHLHLVPRIRCEKVTPSLAHMPSRHKAKCTSTFDEFLVSNDICAILWHSNIKHYATKNGEESGFQCLSWHTHTHTHTYIYIYIYICICNCMCYRSLLYSGMQNSYNLWYTLLGRVLIIIITIIIIMCIAHVMVPLEKYDHQL